MEDRAATKRHMRQRPNYISIVIFITVIVFALLGAYHLLCVHFSEDLLLQKARDVASRSLEEAAASDGTDLSDFSLGDPALEATVSVFDADGALIVSRTYTSDKDAPLYPIWPDESVVSQAREQAPGSFLQTIPYRGRTLFIARESALRDLWICAIPCQQFSRVVSPLTLRLCMMFLVAVILLVALMLYLRIHLREPLKTLIAATRNPEMKSEIASLAERRDEIGGLAYALMTQREETHHLIEKIEEINQMKTDTQVRVLQTQINSHFVYNTLNNIQWLAKAGRIDDVIATVTSLDKLLRATATDGDYVSIEDELDLVEAYLTAQKIRFGNMFSFAFEIDPLLLQMQIPRFILQPLVENSVYHGFVDCARERAQGKIRIVVTRRGHRIDIAIEDNGEGIEKDRIPEILLNERVSSSRYMGIAIGNINRRIKLLCGKEYGIGIHSRVGQGTKVTVTVPIQC